MAESWQLKETTSHQDHVIAHVVGATVLGHWLADEVLYLLLDIGFVWIVFLDRTDDFATSSGGCQ